MNAFDEIALNAVCELQWLFVRTRLHINWIERHLSGEKPSVHQRVAVKVIEAYEADPAAKQKVATARMVALADRFVDLIDRLLLAKTK